MSARLGQRPDATADEPSGNAHCDRRLVEECLRGDATAWETLYRQCHPAILATARAVCAARRDWRDVSDEIAARVWYKLVCDDYRLLRLFAFDRGTSLSTYVAAICRNQALNFGREERRRRNREVTSDTPDECRRENRVRVASGHLDVSFTGFLETLTPRERHLLRSLLFDENSFVSNGSLSACNLRQIRSRLHRKLARYLEG